MLYRYKRTGPGEADFEWGHDDDLTVKTVDWMVISAQENGRCPVMVGSYTDKQGARYEMRLELDDQFDAMFPNVASHHRLELAKLLLMNNLRVNAAARHPATLEEVARHYLQETLLHRRERDGILPTAGFEGK